MNGAKRQNYHAKEAAMPWRAARFELENQGAAAFIAREAAVAWAACGAFEWIALGYLAVSTALIAAFAENLAHPIRLIGLQAVVATLILILCWVEARRGTESVPQGLNPDFSSPLMSELKLRPPIKTHQMASRRFRYFWRHWFPHLFFLFCFEEVGKLVHLVTPAWQDPKLIAFDRWLTGVNPSLWLERFAHPALNEFMQFAYFTYFLYLLILGGVLYHRRDAEGYWGVMTYSAIGYVLGYVISMFFPVQSPWFTFAGMWHSDLAGGPFTALINFIEKCGRVHGAAFPSQHVAGAVAALWGAWQHRRWLFWVFLPFVACMCVSTVYVRNHYVADVLGGIVTGTLGYVVGRWVMKAQGAVGRVTENQATQVLGPDLPGDPTYQELTTNAHKS